MNKEVKQLLIKLAIIVGVIILSAFVTTSFAYLVPNHGDVSTSTSLPRSVGEYYTTSLLSSKYGMCAHKGSPVEDENTYVGGTGGGYDTPKAEKEAIEAGKLGSPQFPATVSLGWNGLGGGIPFNVSATVDMVWGELTKPSFVGSHVIQLTYPNPDNMSVDIYDPNYSSLYPLGSDSVTVGNLSKFKYTPKWQQSGGLGSDDLKVVIVKKTGYLDKDITASFHTADRFGINKDTWTFKMKAKDFLQGIWRKIISYTEDTPLYTTTLGEAHKIDLHKYATKDVDETVFEYIYSEADVSSDNQPHSPVQFANWMALGQSHPYGKGEKSYHDIGNAIYQEGKAYSKFLEATGGELKKEFIDVKENDKILPVEVKSDKEGNFIVGPFAIDYTEWGIDGGRGWAQFAGIYDASVTTNDKPNGLKEDEYEFIYSNDTRETDNLVKPHFPHSKEAFYIKIKKADNRTEFRGVDFKFRYLNVEGSAIEIEESLYYYKWYVDEDADSYFLQAKEYKKDVQQAQDIDFHGSRSYMTDDLHYSMYPVHLTIEKHIANELDGGNQLIDGHNFDLGKTYKFQVSLHASEEDAKTGNNPLCSYDISLKDDQPESITQYFKDPKYFDDGVDIPYYRVVETDKADADSAPKFMVNNENGEFSEKINTEPIENAEYGIYGRCFSNRSVSVACYNYYKIHGGQLVLTKKLSEPAVEQEVYKLKVSIIDNANNIITDKSSPIEQEIELRVAPGQTEADFYIDDILIGRDYSLKYYWRGDAPSYKITEQENDKYRVSFEKNGDGVKVNDEITGKFDNYLADSKGNIIVDEKGNPKEEIFFDKDDIDVLNSRANSKIRIDKISEPELEVGDEKTYFFKIKVGTKYDIDTNITLENHPDKPGFNAEDARHKLSPVYDIVLDNKNGDPYVITEFPNEESRLKGENGTIVSEGILTEEDGNDETKYTKTATNIQKPKEIEYMIRKTFEDDNIPEDDLVFTFDTKADQKRIVDGSEQMVEISHDELKASKDSNWETEKARVAWAYGTETPIITIKEAQDQRYFVNGFNVIRKSSGKVVSTLGASDYTIDTQTGTIVLTQSGVNKLLDEINKSENKNDIEFIFEVVNKVGDIPIKIVINKMIEGEGNNPDDPNEYPFEFQIDVKYPGRDDVISETVIASNKRTAEKVVIWKGDLAPESITIYEIKKSGSELTGLVVNGEKQSIPVVSEGKYLLKKLEDITVADTEILIDATNKNEYQGSVNIEKILVDRFGNKLDSSKVFSFRVKKIINSNVVEDKKVEIKAGENYPYAATWESGETAEFEISEIAIDGYAIKNIDVTPNDGIEINNGVVKGKFAANSTIKVTYTNEEVKPLEGNIVIQKKAVSTTGAAIPQDYNRKYAFTLKVNGEVVKNDIMLGSGESYKYSTSWNSNQAAPTYEVFENDTTPRTITKNGGNVAVEDNGVVTGSFIENSTIEYEYINGEDVKIGKLSLTKKLTSDSVDINEDFYFNIKIDGKDLPQAVIKVGEVWESEYYTWIGDVGPEFEITEEETKNSTFKRFTCNINGTEKSGRTITGNLVPMDLMTVPSVQVICENETNMHDAVVKVTKKGIINTVKNVSEEDMYKDYNGKDFLVDVSIVYSKGNFFVGDNINDAKNHTYTPEHGYKERITLDVADIANRKTITLPRVWWYGDDQEGPKVIVNEVSMPEGWELLNYNNNNVILKPDTENEIIVENKWGKTSLVMPMGGTVWIDELPDEKNPQLNGKMDQDEVGVPNVGVVIKRYLVKSTNGTEQIIKDDGYAKVYDIDGNEAMNIFPLYTDETGRWDIRYLEIPGVIPQEAGNSITEVKYAVEYVYDGYNYEPTKYIAGFDDEQPDSRKASDYYLHTSPADKKAMADRDDFINKSFALDREDSRTAFNSQFKIISGDSQIASDNSTAGYALGGADGKTKIDLKYKGTQVTNAQGGTSLVSELVTTDSQGRALEPYQVTAYTLFNATDPVGKPLGTLQTAGLAYPFDMSFNVALVSRSIKQGDVYVATDPYLRNVNLGLARRDDADIEVTKDVTGAKVIVNQTLKEYQFSKLHNILVGDNAININIESSDDETMTYNLGLYKTDYYYRAQAYATNADVYNGLKTFYKTIHNIQEDFEKLMNLQAYVTYTIRVRNSSPSEKYDVGVRSIMDYSDTSLELVKTNVSSFIKDGDGSSAGSMVTVAEAPHYQLKNETETHEIQIIDSGNNTVSNNTYTTIRDEATSRTYNRTEMRFAGNGIRLEPNQYVDIFATYRLKNYSEDPSRPLFEEYESVNTNAIDADGIELGNKANIAELKAYSVFKATSDPSKKGKMYAGKLDKDSAPNNIDIISRNNKAYYEDDTYAAPFVNIQLENNNPNTVTGTVWEDNEITGDSIVQGVSLGDGVYDPTNEGTIEGMNVELVEKIQIPVDGPNADGKYTNYYEYDFTWPENYDVQHNTIVNPRDIKEDDTVEATKNTLKSLTGFDSTISSAENGVYKFENAPTGNYIVRFHYGDNNGGYTDKSVSFASATNLTEGDVYKFPQGGDNMKSSRNIEGTNTSAYDGDKLPVVYNGHDFKSALYALDLNAEWLNNSEPENISKAADSQARRLEVINKSRVLVNANTTILATANESSESHNKLYDEYRMFADTPKIKFDGKTNVFNNVGFGIVERPETRLVLDKEIEQLIIRDNSGRALIEIDYDINYSNEGVIEQLSDGSFMLKDPSLAVTINEEKSFGTEYLQSLNKVENKYGFLNTGFNSGVQNFRYIVYDTSMAQSLTLETKYRITALNLGQADRTSVVLQNMNSAEINAVAQILKANKFNGENRTFDGEGYGVYKVVGNVFKNGDRNIVTITNRFTDILGNTYYKGDYGNDIIVKSKVGQVIDYVDNTLEFDQSINTAIDGSWTSTTDDYLYHNDVVDKSLFETVNYNLLQGDAATSEMRSKIVDKDGKYYDSNNKHNLILSVTNVDSTSVNNANPTFLQEMIAPTINAEGKIVFTNPSGERNAEGNELMFNSVSAITLKTTSSMDGKKDDLIFDNIAEIIRYENKVGRRTTTTVAGNADPRGAYTYDGKTTKLGEFAGALNEIDASATEIITFSNPYGVSEKAKYITEITIGIFSTLVIVAVGIVVVKKKVL